MSGDGSLVEWTRGLVGVVFVCDCVECVLYFGLDTVTRG
jgi:hypothetical protein